MGKKIPTKSGQTVRSRKFKMRPQDPCNPVAMDDGLTGMNCDPVKDDDIVHGDFGDAFAANMVPGFKSETGSGAANDDENPMSKRERRRKKNGCLQSTRKPEKKAPEAGEEKVDLSQRAGSEKESMPRQKQGENAKAYAKRVDEHLKAQLGKASQKIATSTSRDKKRKHIQGQRERALEKTGNKKSRTDDDDGLYKAAERPVFGDVALRPPVMNADVLKSKAKLEAIGTADAGMHGRRPELSPELNDYASKVRLAYAELKKKRGSRV